MVFETIVSRFWQSFIYARAESSMPSSTAWWVYESVLGPRDSHDTYRFYGTILDKHRQVWGTTYSNAEYFGSRQVLTRKDKTYFENKKYFFVWLPPTKLKISLIN